MNGSKSNWRVWVSAAVLFLLGAVTGIAGAMGYIHHWIGDLHGNPQAFEGMAVHLIDREVDLSDAQRVEIQEIIEATHYDLWAFKNEHVSEIEAILEPALQEIGAVLTDKQREVWGPLRERIQDHIRFDAK